MYADAETYSPPPFKLERYLAQHEFQARYFLSASDCESLTLRELLALADPASRAGWEDLGLGYTESAGHPALRAAVAGLYETRRADDVLILAPAEGIWIAMHALLSPGDHVVALFPAYQSLYEVARFLGCPVTQWSLTPTPTGWHLDLDQLARHLTPQTRLLVLNFPHNPTGYQPTPAEWTAILDLARQHELYVFSDEMYRLLEYDPADRLPAACDVYERGISLSGLSKSFGLPGLRIGWLVTPDRAVLTRCAALKDYTTICNSAPSEALAVMALRAGDTILARNRAIIQVNLATAARFFAEHAAQFTWRPPRAGSVAFPEWTGGGSVAAFCQMTLDEQGVLMVPGHLFDLPGEHFRLGLGRRNLAAALDRMGQILRKEGA
ncbi:MAG: aminotransferase class I/II-fold pyridoxal phosphate-dependent enzyme [Chloroflexi bacterium]|nr:aminotransferase class I/II-fold pyridoxal phosphate-dependent enzyme [Chloroflexota bacterium]MBU1878007.1 aminotransferase class I/II-fold pyridoxal phosphate-dependent enzyme [Chloroflexota bacterium]